MPDAYAAPSEILAQDRYPLLSRPIELGGIRLRNRVAHASITTRFAKDNRVTEQLITQHASRADGGCAMIITEPLAVLKWQTDETHKVRAWDDDEMEGLKRWADAVESRDCRLIGQLQDSGRGMHHKGRKPISFSASALPDDLSWTVPHALEPEKIAEIVAQMAEATRRMQRAGFSGVEFSAGHGHLIHQFLSPHSNIRTDQYGGSLENRTRFLAEMIRALRAAVGRNFIIMVKLPGDDGVEGGIDILEAERILREVVALGEIDALSFCQGSHHRTLENHMPDMHWPRAPFNALTRHLRQAAGGIPVAALGRLVEPVQAEQALAEEVGDFVQIGRALITDPAWVNKAFSGREHEIRWCVSCNSCWGLIAEKRVIGCDNNPRVGTAGEADWRPIPAPARKRVVVVGAGPAGLEAAWVAAARGHEVTVLGAGSSYGGKLALLARLPGSDQVSSVYDYQIVKGARAGVRYEYGVTATAQDILTLQPDCVVLATGATQSWPGMLPAEWRDDGVVPDLRAASEMLLDGFPRQPGTALIFDADHTAGTYAAAELMSQIFDSVTIATPRAQIAADEALVVTQGIERRMAMLGVNVIPLVEPSGDSALIDGIITFRNVYSKRTLEVPDVALFAYSTSRIPNDQLAAPLRKAGLDVRLIGDCFAPRYLLMATAEGHAAGNAI
jgi:2,4-dienoyl-CoA reductase-like NADH-dependent reductase (Old Yellow Enzyme family)/NADPH-dependent 2,4-dienoyl-CoA reductase/sulfur reductase-like enzyme